jgi:hypothetical protein
MRVTGSAVLCSLVGLPNGFPFLCVAGACYATVLQDNIAVLMPGWLLVAFVDVQGLQLLPIADTYADILRAAFFCRAQRFLSFVKCASFCLPPDIPVSACAGWHCIPLMLFWVTVKYVLHSPSAV